MKTLLILSSLRGVRTPDGKIIITQKFLDGVLAYVRFWPGKVVVLLESEKQSSNNLDNVSVDVEQLPFHLKLVNYDSIQEELEFQTASLVLAAASYRQNKISLLCKAKEIPCIYVTEYNLRTRIQIIDATTDNFPLRIRRRLWEAKQEWSQRRAISRATGVQCNGTPTFDAYRQINGNSLLYFDTRIDEELLITETELEQRTASCASNNPLRLLFSGRLIAIKGADHLVPVALELTRLGVRFEMFICGDGDLRASLQSQIVNHGLSNSVKMLGVLDFKKELVPFVKRGVDLFVCCHRQGDPSCTYLETMSCGVPIVGYDNEAFSGLMKRIDAGWSVSMNRVDLLAQKIGQLDLNRELIVEKSRRAAEFSRQHSFAKTFRRRMDHILNALNSRPPLA